MLTFADIQIKNNLDNNSTNTLIGYILTEEDGWTEGIIKDSNDNENFIFGVFNRPSSLSIYSLNPNKPKDFHEFSATKSSLYPYYTGKRFLIDNSIKQYINTCKIASRLLEKDPRDFDNAEKENFINNLKKWKISNLTDEALKIYNEYLSNRTILTKNINLDTDTIR